MSSANPFAELFEADEDSVDGYVPGAGDHGADLGPFRDANAAMTRRRRVRGDYAARFALIRRQFPSTTYGEQEWRQIFRDRPEIFKAICLQLATVDAAEDQRDLKGRGRDGHRPNPGYAEGARRLLRMFGKEFSLLPFPEAFAVLCRNRSHRHVVAKTGLSKGQVWRLLKGEAEPTAEIMETVAAAFHCHPSYFIEWRTAYVVAALHDRMSASPEISADLYEKVICG